MLPQGVLGFHYESDLSAASLTSLGRLPRHQDLIQASGLVAAIREQVRVAGAPGRGKRFRVARGLRVRPRIPAG